MISPTVHEFYDIIYNQRDKNVAYMSHHFDLKTIPILEQEFLQYHPFTKKLIFNRDYNEHAINTLIETLKPVREFQFLIDLRGWRVNESIRDFIESIESKLISKKTPYDTWKEEFKSIHTQLSSMPFYIIIDSHELFLSN